jgi:hypothetical protein
MPRKPVQKPVESKPTTPAQVVRQEPSNPIPNPIVPKTEVKGEGTRIDDGRTTNDLVIQKVSVPFVRKYRGQERVERKDYLRIFVRSDESHDEPDAHWDAHEPEDEAALKQLFTTYGKGSGTTILVRTNVDTQGNQEFFLDVRHPKPDQEDDDKLPSVLVNLKDSVGDLALDLFYELSGKDPPDDFVTRGALEDVIDELKGDVEELDPIRSLLDEFTMPGDLPGHLYSLPERLRSIFETMKRGTK